MPHTRRTPTAPGPVIGVVVAMLLVASPGCGGGDDDPPVPDAGSLTGSLNSLRADQSFDDAQVRCVAEALVAGRDDDARRALADQLARFDQSQALSSFDEETRADFTAAVGDCAGTPGG